MTTSKPYHGQGDPVTFGRPTIGPRVYVVKGPSGWMETYPRKLADQELVRFLSPIQVPHIVEAFIDSISLHLEGRQENWEDVVGYLARMTQQHVRAIPEMVTVAFWAHIVLYEHQQGAN